MIKNLRNQNYPERFTVTDTIDTVYKEAKQDDAYSLSIPLLASAQQGDETLYKVILPKMKKALNNIPNEKIALKAWLLGRVLLASDYIGDYATTIEAQAKLKILLEEKSMPQNAFSTWAWGYLASFNNDEYKQSKEILLSRTLDLTKSYQNKKAELANKELKESDKKALADLSTDAMWAWVMDLQAAANAGDKQTYQYILNQVKEMTGQFSIKDALSKGLTPNDYPALAFSIVSLAAVTIGDEALYNELKHPLQNTIQTAKNSGIKPEEVLAQLNSQLATIRWDKSHQQQMQNQDTLMSNVN